MLLCGYKKYFTDRLSSGAESRHAVRPDRSIRHRLAGPDRHLVVAEPQRAVPALGLHRGARESAVLVLGGVGQRPVGSRRGGYRVRAGLAQRPVGALDRAAPTGRARAVVLASRKQAEMILFGVDNGILAKIRGDDVAAGGQLLPAAGPGQPPELSAVVDTPAFGKVRITYRLKSSPRKKTGLWFWTAFHAVAVPSSDPLTADDPDLAHRQDRTRELPGPSI